MASEKSDVFSMSVFSDSFMQNKNVREKQTKNCKNIAEKQKF